MKVLIVVVARGGSKRLKNKNMLPLGELRLVEFAFHAGLHSAYATHLCISTDAEHIGRLGEKWGYKWIKRPPEISTDTSDISEAVQHALTYYPGMDYVVTLQGAVPLRPEGAIDALVDAVIKNQARGGVSCVEAPPFVWRIHKHGMSQTPADWDVDNYPRTQDLPTHDLAEVNSIQVAPAYIAEAGYRWRYPLVLLKMPRWADIDIDTKEDYLEAQRAWLGIREQYTKQLDYPYVVQQKPLTAQCKGGYCEMCRESCAVSIGR